MAFDVAIVGGGPGGYTAAHEAAARRLSVVLFERRDIGGTCLNRGCIPTKTLLHDTGLHEAGARRDPDALREHRDAVVGQLRSGVEGMLAADGVTLVRGEATIAGAGIVSCEGTPYEASHVIVATGAAPNRPPIEGSGLPGVVTSDDVLEGEGLDMRSLVIVGGGVIGVECAQIYAALGAEVSVLEATARILPPFDRELAQRANSQLRGRGVMVGCSVRVTSIREEGGMLVVRYADRKGEAARVTAEAVLLATGRHAETDGLFVAGCEPVTERGAIVCDEHGRSSLPWLFAVGDVRAGGTQLAHVAQAQARNVVAAICGEEGPVDERVVPSCVYTSPELAQVGLTVEEAKAAGLRVRCPKVPTGANGRSVIEGGAGGYVRLVVDAGTDRIVGAQLACPRATDLVAELALAIHLGATAADVAATIHPHPSVSEMVAEAAGR